MLNYKHSDALNYNFRLNLYAPTGDFKARVKGIGPTVSYIKEFGDIQFVAELKWISEFDVERRAEGDLIYLKMVLSK